MEYRCEACLPDARAACGESAPDADTAIWQQSRELAECEALGQACGGVRRAAHPEACAAMPSCIDYRRPAEVEVRCTSRTRTRVLGGGVR